MLPSFQHHSLSRAQAPSSGLCYLLVRFRGKLLIAGQRQPVRRDKAADRPVMQFAFANTVAHAAAGFPRARYRAWNVQMVLQTQL